MTNTTKTPAAPATPAETPEAPVVEQTPPEPAQAPENPAQAPAEATEPVADGQTAPDAVDLTTSVLQAVYEECQAQVEQWGEQHHPNGTGGSLRVEVAAMAKRATDEAVEAGTLTWLHILDEEVKEAFAETDPAALRTELVQVAAVASAWVRALDAEAVAK